MTGNDLVKARRARRFAVLAVLRRRGAHVDYPSRYANHKLRLAKVAAYKAAKRCA